MKIYYTNKHLQNWLHAIIRQMQRNQFRPDYIVGITRGGCIPATMLSHYLDVPMHTLNVSFRDSGTGPESNLWMAEDAFGYIPAEQRQDAEFEITHLPVKGDISNPKLRKNILIVDDINDSGRTLQWIKDDWESGCFPHNKIWNDIWHHNVQFAVMVNNTASTFKNVDFYGTEINKLETPAWVVFPWENWWEL